MFEVASNIMDEERIDYLIQNIILLFEPIIILLQDDVE